MEHRFSYDLNTFVKVTPHDIEIVWNRSIAEEQRGFRHSVRIDRIREFLQKKGKSGLVYPGTNTGSTCILIYTRKITPEKEVRELIQNLKKFVAQS